MRVCPPPFRPRPRMFNTHLLLGGVVHEVEAADHRLERLVGGHDPVDRGLYMVE